METFNGQCACGATKIQFELPKADGIPKVCSFVLEVIISLHSLGLTEQSNSSKQFATASSANAAQALVSPEVSLFHVHQLHSLPKLLKFITTNFPNQ